MECISIFDMLKIGIGPSSSHTLGPWRAAERWIAELRAAALFDQVAKVQVHAYGSLSLTGKGHATDYAIVLGLSGADPEYIPVADIHHLVQKVKASGVLLFGKSRSIPFVPSADIIFHRKIPSFSC